ncbi:MAG: hypothetical protein Q7S09_00830 [bacterium]|nr:hypothetical protein [bacterium]
MLYTILLFENRKILEKLLEGRDDGQNYWIALWGLLEHRQNDARNCRGIASE